MALIFPWRVVQTTGVTLNKQGLSWPSVGFVVQPVVVSSRTRRRGGQRRPSSAEGAWLQQKGRPPRLEELLNWSSRLLGTHPLKALPSRYSVSRLERLPSSAGISPLKLLALRCSHSRLERLLSSAGISPLKLVVAEEQIYQVGEAAQLRRYLPAQLVVVEAQPFKVGEAAQLRRYLPAQAVVGEGTDMSGWRGCPAPPVSPRSSRCR